MQAKVVKIIRSPVMTDIPLLTELRTGFAAGTRVMTVKGPEPVETLQPGDRIVTRQGVRRLRAAPARVWVEPDAITIRASALGHGRPETDLTVAREQPVVLRDWRAEALYGTARAAVTASKLLDGVHVLTGPTGPLRIFDLVFDTAQTIYAEGIEVQTVLRRDETAAP
jgi:hypothetical protein